MFFWYNGDEVMKMKKFFKIILSIFVLGCLLFLVDIVSIKFFNKVLLEKKENNKYVGLFYNVYNCNNKLLIKSNNVKYSCEITNYKIKEINDTSKNTEGFVCLSTLEEIYKDTKYIYSLPCIKSEYIIVKYENDNTENIKDALKNKHISIKNLDKYNIKYYKDEI